MSRTVPLVAFVAALVHTSACGETPPPQATLLPEPPQSTASAVASAATSAAPPVAEGTVLAFYEVDDTIDPFRSLIDDPTALPSGVEAQRENAGDGIRVYLIVEDGPDARAQVERATKAVSNLIPPGRKLVWEHLGEMRVGRPHYRSYVLGPRFLSEKNVSAASAEEGEMGAVQVTLQFDEAGKSAFADATRRALGGRIAILAFGETVSVPTVMSEINSGSAVLGMKPFTGLPEAKRLAAALNR